MNTQSYILSAFAQTPWAILPQKLAVLEEIVLRHAKGETINADEAQMTIHGAARPQQHTRGSVAVLPLFGTIFPRANLMTSMSGATSAETFGAAFRALLNDQSVSAIVLDVNSPGGQAGGIQELADMIYNARGIKPVVAVANHFMASAAYWIGTAAGEMVVSPSAEVGSIGVFTVHADYSAQLERDGVKVSVIKAGKYKAEGNPYQPLTEEAVAAMQLRISETYDDFVNAVARNRNVSAEVVRNGFGEGRMVPARQAVASGMADRIGTLEETVQALQNAPQTPPVNRPKSASVEENAIAANQPASSAGFEAGDEREREASRLRDYLEVYK